MNKKSRLARLVSIEKSALGSVVGGRRLDLADSWAFSYLAHGSCYREVLHSAAYAGYEVGGGVLESWPDAAWSAANDAANAAWNGPACRNYGWW
ncbi:MAG TPA: hypothetical protein VKN99_07640 [Polyangia bacterium]|nr:hypothetical protein [Polyangia bacterium]